MDKYSTVSTYNIQENTTVMLFYFSVTSFCNMWNFITWCLLLGNWFHTSLQWPLYRDHMNSCKIIYSVCYNSIWSNECLKFQYMKWLAAPTRRDIKHLNTKVFSLEYRFTSETIFLPSRTKFSLCTCNCTVGKKQVPFSMATGNVELMQECFANTSAWEQQEWNKKKKQMNNTTSMERS